MKRVIGFDPGFAIVGYGVLDYEDFRNIKVVDYGVITTPKEESFPVRLAIIYKGVQELIKSITPTRWRWRNCFQHQYHHRHKRGSRKGRFAACRHSSLRKFVRVHSVTNKAGYDGIRQSHQKQIQEMVKTYLSLAAVPKPDDAADALAVALTHAQTGGFTEKFYIR